jgi:hypothetical protein
MLRRAQLALALILLLVLAPLAGATCGIKCMAATPHHPVHAASAQHPCMRASACCPSNGPAICGATNAPGAIAALLNTDTNATHDAPTLASVAAAYLSLNHRSLSADHIDSLPPGQHRAANPIPLRV